MNKKLISKLELCTCIFLIYSVTCINGMDDKSWRKPVEEQQRRTNTEDQSKKVGFWEGLKGLFGVRKKQEELPKKEIAAQTQTKTPPVTISQKRDSTPLQTSSAQGSQIGDVAKKLKEKEKQEQKETVLQQEQQEDTKLVEQAKEQKATEKEAAKKAKEEAKEQKASKKKEFYLAKKDLKAAQKEVAKKQREYHAFKEESKKLKLNSRITSARSATTNKAYWNALADRLSKQEAQRDIQFDKIDEALKKARGKMDAAQKKFDAADAALKELN